MGKYIVEEVKTLIHVPVGGESGEKSTTKRQEKVSLHGGEGGENELFDSTARPKKQRGQRSQNNEHKTKKKRVRRKKRKQRKSGPQKTNRPASGKKASIHTAS